MRTHELGVKILATVSGILLLTVGLAPVAFADTGSFSISGTSGRPGYAVAITSSDPCPVLPGVNQSAAVSFMDADNNTTVTPLLISSGTGVWWSNQSVTIPTSASQGAGEITAYCFNTSGYAHTYEYDPITYTIVGTAPKLATSSKIARGERLFMKSLEPCPSSTTSVQASLWKVSGGQQYALGAGLLWDKSWAVNNYTIPANAPLGSYRTDVTCYGSQLVTYAEQLVEIVATPQYVALGDSYSAGEGTYDYLPDSKAYHRSDESYPYYVADEKNLGTPTFVACSGARTADLYETNPSNPGEGPQVGRLQDATQVVSLTIGGNDAGFATVISECAQHAAHSGWGCKNNTSLTASVDDRLDALAGTDPATGDDGRTISSLKQVYLDISYAAPNAKIFVGGYPKLFGSSQSYYDSNSAAPSGKVCDLTAFVTLDYDDALWLNQVGDDLNDIIEDAVQEARNEGANVYFVSPALFSGHGLCDSGEPWITPVTLTGPEAGWPPKPLPESLHPTVSGQSMGYGDAFVSTMNYYD